jgi:hypothetical protein
VSSRGATAPGAAAEHDALGLVSGLLLGALREGRRITLRAAGRSMEPTIPEGSQVAIEPLAGRRARAGEIVAVERPDGGLALHRVVSVLGDGRAITWGDAMPSPDGWGPRAPLGAVRLIAPGGLRPAHRRVAGALRARAHVLLGNRFLWQQGLRTVRWLPLGPLAVRVDAPVLPWPLAALARPSPGRARWTARLSCELAPGAGLDGPPRLAGGAYEGPGFELIPCGNDRYAARLASPDALPGALSALLIDAGRSAPLLLLHAGSLLFSGRAVLVLGRSGSGKSTLVARHAARALGSNAALVWPSTSGALLASALPLTGKGDAATRAGAYPVAGVLVLGAPRRRPLSVAEAAAWVVAHAAAASGVPPPLDAAIGLASACSVRGARSTCPG